MKKFLKMLQFILLLPIIPIIGVGGGASGTSGGEGAGGNGGEGGKEGEGSGGDNSGNSDNKGDAKTHTQADVDKAVKERLAREKKKYEKMLEDMKKQMTGEGEGAGAQGGTGTGEGQGQTDPNNDTAVKAQQALAAANQRLVSATAQTEAIKLGVDPKYIADVVRLADLSKVEVKEDGTMDTGVISKALDDVLKRVPVFKTTAENAGGFKVGGQGQQGSNAWGKKQEGQQGQQQVSQKRWNRFNQ